MASAFSIFFAHASRMEQIPDCFISKTYVKPDGTKLCGVDACIEAAFGPYKEKLADDWASGWEELMLQDGGSVRAYMRNVMQYPWSVVQWAETRDSGSGAFDYNGFAEVGLLCLSPDRAKPL